MVGQRLSGGEPWVRCCICCKHCGNMLTMHSGISMIRNGDDRAFIEEEDCDWPYNKADVIFLHCRGGGL